MHVQLTSTCLLLNTELLPSQISPIYCGGRSSKNKVRGYVMLDIVEIDYRGVHMQGNDARYHSDLQIEPRSASILCQQEVRKKRKQGVEVNYSLHILRDPDTKE